MRRLIPSAFLFTTFSFITTTDITAQNDRFAYAITDATKDGVNWQSLRKLDFHTGKYSDVLLNGADRKNVMFDAVSKKELPNQPDAKWGDLIQLPFSTGVAAAAYDKSSNRLYFAPMFVDQLRYVDLKTMKVYTVADQPLTGSGHMHNDEAKVVTRMVIAPDGFGYAISNDGTSLVRFTTGKKVQIEKLGTLVDDPANTMSIHNRCTSFGGDMICDDKGNLFILTAPNQVFKVNVETKVATHIAGIQNLPPTFTVNGAVVDGDGNLLVSSAVDASSYYVVDSKNWTAKPFEAGGEIFKSSDLANSNYLSTTAKTTEIPVITRAEERFSKLISVYPNPVTINRVSIQFNKVPHGDYVVEMTDVLGRSIYQKQVTVNSEAQTQVLPLNGSKGIYMVKVFDQEKQSVFTQKVVVQ